MFLAQLSALDLGAYVTIRGVKRGSKYQSYYSGVLTQVSHNSEGTKVRLDRYLRGTSSTPDKERAVEVQSGDAMTFSHGVELSEYVEPPG